MSVGNFIVLIIILCAAVALTVIVITSSRSMQQKSAPKPTRQENRDPVTQPIRISEDKSSPNPIELSAPPAVNESMNAYARLIRLHDDNLETLPNAFIILKHPVVTIGSDPALSDVILTEPSIAPQHACFTLATNGAVTLSDQGSASGTRVNFAPLSRKGIRLENLDIIHIGKMVFRFELLNQR